MQAELPAVVESLIGPLLQCRHKKSLNDAKRLHAYLQHQELELHPVLGNFLIPMLVDCGSLPQARHVFDRLPQPNEHSWTSLICSYVEAAQPHPALGLYRHMLMQQDEPVLPNRAIYLALLHACTALKDVETSRDLHAEITKRGLDQDIFDGSPVVGNTLVDVYAKCGLLAEAFHSFSQLPFQSAVSWTALMGAYAEQGLAEETWDLLLKMQLNGITPDSVTFVCSLRACCTTRALETGQKVHAETTKRGLERGLYVGSALLDMYAKCSTFAEARLVFDTLPGRDAVSWAALIAGYAEAGFSKEADKCYYQMKVEGISPDLVIFICTLKARGSTGELERVYEIHTDLTTRGWESGLFVGSALVDAYIKCHALPEAQHVFNGSPAQDTVAWNSLIKGYIEHGLADEALTCFHKMLLEDLSPDLVTFICSLKACGIKGVLETGQEIHTEITKRGLEKEHYMGNALLDMFTKCGSLAEAQQVFDRLSVQDAVSWNALIAGYASCGLDEEVLNHFRGMQLQSVCVDALTFVLCLKASGNLGASEVGREVHSEIMKLGLEGNLHVSSMLVDMYGKCGFIAEGQKVFDKLPAQNIVSWNTMLKAYGENHEGDMAVKCFEDMKKEGLEPNSLTFTCLLAACSHASLILKAQEYFKLMINRYAIEPTQEHYACMVDLLARSGHVYEAGKLLAAIESPLSSLAVKALLTACRIYGKVELGERCFQQLVEVNHEDASAYSLMRDLYASVGMLNDANRIEEMRSYAGAKKKPGSTSIEVNQKPHKFIVSIKRSPNISEMLKTLRHRIKDEGYMPNLDQVSGHILYEQKTSSDFVHNFHFHLNITSDNFATLHGLQTQS